MFNIDFSKLIQESLEGNEVSFKDFSLETIKEKIPTYSSEKLCEMIVSVRYLNFLLSDEVDVLCMEELAKRRINGSDFKFEDQIESLSKDLPELDFSNNGFDIRKILAQVGKI